MIGFRINDPGQIADALAEAVRTCGDLGATHSFTVGPFDDNELAEKLVVYVDGADEVEASEVLGQRLIAAGIPFDAA